MTTNVISHKTSRNAKTSRMARKPRLAKFAIVLLVVAILSASLSRQNGAAASLPTTPCTGSGTVTCELWATTGSIPLPGGVTATVWGYAANSTDPAGLPGPVLIVNQGETVNVTLHNNLGENTALHIPGLQMAPDLTGIAPGGSKTYTFNASQPGTFLYEASPLIPNAEHQVAMGMSGGLVVRPSASATQAYANPATAFNEEALLVLGEIDLNLNNSASPAGFDMRTYHPTYFLINGKSYPDTDPISVSAGNKVLLRFVNSGLQAHSMSTLGLKQNVIAIDGSPFNFARRLTADTIFTGQTLDALVQTAATAPDGTRYAVFDSAFILSNNSSSGFGGMLTFLTLTGGTITPGDTVGPLATAITLTPNRLSGGNVNLTGTISDALSGNSNVTKAEYFIDTVGGDGSGTAMSGSFGSPSATVNASFNVSTLGLTTGYHNIYVHGQDSQGNWGAMGSAVLAVDKSGPAIIGAQVLPDPSQGNGLLLEASADDRSNGDSEVTGMTYSLDGGAPVSMTLDSSASTFFYTAPISAAGNGTHTLSLVATDQLGNVGSAFSLTFTVDNSGPTTTGVAVNPASTNGLNQSVNSTLAVVRVTASFSDTASNIYTAEGFIDSVGADGTGFPFVATGGLFTSQNGTGYADIPLSQFWVLPAGVHTIYVHAQDAAGNWGTPSSTTITVTH